MIRYFPLKKCLSLHLWSESILERILPNFPQKTPYNKIKKNLPTSELLQARSEKHLSFPPRPSCAGKKCLNLSWPTRTKWFAHLGGSAEIRLLGRHVCRTKLPGCPWTILLVNTKNEVRKRIRKRPETSPKLLSPPLFPLLVTKKGRKARSGL